MIHLPKVSQKKNPADLESGSTRDMDNPLADEPGCENTTHAEIDNGIAGNKQSEGPGEQRDLILTHKEAQAGSPDDIAACGEEDIGAGLELLVTRDDHKK